MEPDYSSCTLDELLDVHSQIDKDTYPERFSRLAKEIELKQKAQQGLEVENASNLEILKIENKVYKPIQILLGSFIGGPTATVYFLRENFTSLGQPQNAKRTLYIGLSFVMLLFISLPFLPSDFPSTPLPVLYCLLGFLISKNHQFKEKTNSQKILYQYHSNWKVCWVAILNLVLSFIMITGVVLITP